MRIPADVREGLREKLWSLGDQLDWSRLEWYEKSSLYESWTRDPTIGGHLAHFMDPNKVRVYLKDTVMKAYTRTRQANPANAFRALGLEASCSVVEEYERPHGRRLADGRVIAWGSAEDWKLILMAVHERSFGLSEVRPHACVLLSSVGKFSQPSVRSMVEGAATKLGIERLAWLA